MGEYSVVGKSVERTDGRVKVTGKAKYAGDLVAPGMLHGKLLRSPLAHAKILNIDTEQSQSASRRHRSHYRKRLSRDPLWHPTGYQRSNSHAHHQGPPFWRRGGGRSCHG